MSYKAKQLVLAEIKKLQYKADQKRREADKLDEEAEKLKEDADKL